MRSNKRTNKYKLAPEITATTPREKQIAACCENLKKALPSYCSAMPILVEWKKFNKRGLNSNITLMLDEPQRKRAKKDGPLIVDGKDSARNASEGLLQQLVEDEPPVESGSLGNVFDKTIKASDTNAEDQQLSIEPARNILDEIFGTDYQPSNIQILSSNDSKLSTQPARNILDEIFGTDYEPEKTQPFQPSTQTAFYIESEHCLRQLNYLLGEFDVRNQVRRSHYFESTVGQQNMFYGNSSQGQFKEPTSQQELRSLPQKNFLK